MVGCNPQSCAIKETALGDTAEANKGGDTTGDGTAVHEETGYDGALTP